MRTTLAIDDLLLNQAQVLTGLKEKSSLVREALKALIERESARRLALLGGTEPALEAAPRRRSATTIETVCGFSRYIGVGRPSATYQCRVNCAFE